jgi:riboflavin kinase/FMN adenylyltransferase
VEVVRLETLGARGWPRPAVTVGNFDGVHRGHQALVNAAIDAARALQGTNVVLTFDPHPSHVLSPHRAPDALMTIAQKAEILGGLGIAKLAVLPFTPELAQKTAEEFAREVLRGAMGAERVIVGTSFRFGRNREGDPARLADLGGGLGFTVQAVDPVLHDGIPISSTRIREALARGATDAAQALLGRRFFVDGLVRRGEQRGRKIGFPTANIDPQNETVPGGGVYACWCRLLDEKDGALRPGVVNVGRRPTFGAQGSLLVEAHLFDFDGDLYGRPLRVEFERRLRDERAFPGIEALRAQIAADAAEARRLLVIARRSS